VRCLGAVHLLSLTGMTMVRGNSRTRQYVAFNLVGDLPR